MNKETLYTIETFDFNALFATAEVTTTNTAIIHSAPVKTQERLHTCARPESCIQLNGLRDLGNALGWR